MKDSVSTAGIRTRAAVFDALISPMDSLEKSRNCSFCQITIDTKQCAASRHECY